ncbi:MAG: DUF2490 domain-containing protein [Candidatus Acidiferrales bacterium]
MKNCCLVRILLGTFLIFTFCSRTAGQSQTSSTDTQAWPEVDFHIQMTSSLRTLTLAGTEQGVGFPFQQCYAAAALGYQGKPILREHLTNIDPDKERYFLVGGGYEFLHTTNSGKETDEDRVTLDGTFGFRPTARFLVRDRNWIELRWIDGAYSTTYRNMVTVERDFLVRGFRLTPYGSAEVFYDSPKHSWNEEWYTGGIEWPYKSLFMIDTYYKREHCDTCNPTNWNVGGVTLSFYFGNAK